MAGMYIAQRALFRDDGALAGKHDYRYAGLLPAPLRHASVFEQTCDHRGVAGESRFAAARRGKRQGDAS